MEQLFTTLEQITQLKPENEEEVTENSLAEESTQYTR